MLRYSTYRSIYNEPPADAAARSGDHFNRADRLAKSVLAGAYAFTVRQNLLKLTLVLLLVISGFTVVSQVFAGSIPSPDLEKRVVVEPGDTLWSIALENKPSSLRTVVYIEAIKRYNNLSSPDIQAGDVLSVPVYK